MQIYVDESGDLGFSGTGSRFMVIAFVAAGDATKARRIKKAVLRVKGRLGVDPKGEIKAAGSPLKTRLQVCRELAALDIQIQYAAVLKDKVYPLLRADTNILYNYITGLLLVPCITPLMRAHICFDKRIIKVTSGRSLADYIRAKVWGDNRSDCDITIQNMESHLCGQLQAADFVNNAIFRYYEHGDLDCYRALRPIIKRKLKLFF